MSGSFDPAGLKLGERDLSDLGLRRPRFWLLHAAVLLTSSGRYPNRVMTEPASTALAEVPTLPYSTTARS